MFARGVSYVFLVWVSAVFAVRGQESTYFEQHSPEAEWLEEAPSPSRWIPLTAEGFLAPETEEHAPPSEEGMDTSPLPLLDGTKGCLAALLSVPDEVFIHRDYLPRTWGFAGLSVFASGNKMAPNGQIYYPLGTLFFDFNIGLLPQKRLYVFTQGAFWAQKPSSGITNGSQGNFDFSKRQMDITLGGAWRYYGPLEFRVFAFSYNNLNRGFDLNVPEGYNDGVGFENRYYIFKSNAFDLPRLNFLSLGYMPTKEVTGADGIFFKPGLFARAYLTYEFVKRKYYVYADTELLCQQAANPRLLFLDDGFAARPFNKLPGLEFRLGVFNTVDVQVDNCRTLVYATFQFLF